MSILIDRVMAETGCSADCGLRFKEEDDTATAFHGRAHKKVTKERGPEAKGWLSELMDWLASKHEEGG